MANPTARVESYEDAIALIRAFSDGDTLGATQMAFDMSQEELLLVLGRVLQLFTFALDDRVDEFLEMARRQSRFQ